MIALRRVGRLTAALHRANRVAAQGGASRKQAQMDLLRRSEKLKQLTTELKEANAALKALLKERDADRRLLEEKVASNLEQTVRSWLDALAADYVARIRFVWPSSLVLTAPSAGRSTKDRAIKAIRPTI